MKLSLVAAIALLFTCGTASAADRAPVLPAAPADAVHVVTFIDVSVAAIPRAFGVLRTYREAQTRNGVASVDLYQELGRPYRFAINEIWKDAAAYDAGRRSAAATQLMDGVRTLQTAPVHTQAYRGYSAGPVRPAGGGRAQIYGISQFTVPAANAEAAGAIARRYAEASRSGEGGMRFDILQVPTERGGPVSRFAIFESWTGPSDHEGNRVSPAAQQFQRDLEPHVIGEIDDRLYGGFD